MSLQALLVTNTSINIQPPGNSLQPAVGGMTGQGGNTEQWAGPASGPVTCPIASPGVFNGLQLPNGTTVTMTGTTIPTGFTAGTTYYVVATNIANKTFE